MASTATITPIRRSSGGAGPKPLVRAGIYTSSTGVYEAPASSRYQLSLHLGAPVWMACGWGGRVARRLQCEGDMDLTPEGFTGSWEDEEPASFLLIDLAPALVEQAAAGIGLKPGKLGMEPQAQLRDARMQHIAFALKAELEADEPNGRLYLEGLGLALSASLVARYASARDGLRDSQTLSPSRMRRVVDYVESHIEEDLSLQRLAEVAELSLSHFKTLFRRSAGRPVHRYVIERRVERARTLLRQGQLPLAQVAAAAGFAHQSHMARHIRRQLGAAPSEFRTHDA
ncbi:transcriptional regulator, AraC family [Rhizobiales bacterium GAS113]|nr:transcriptional regulator, AraC family [Rhizobiales bacterium GAS113]